MSIPRKIARPDLPPPRLAEGSDRHPDCLIEILGRIVDGLETSRAGGVPGLESREDGPVRWEDERNIYLEMELPDVGRSGFDICFVGGRAFIRLDR